MGKTAKHNDKERKKKPKEKEKKDEEKEKKMTDEEKEKAAIAEKEEFKKAVEQYADPIFYRKTVLPEKQLKLLQPDVDKRKGRINNDSINNVNKADLVGTFKVEESTWRVLGVRPRRLEPIDITEYEALQVPRKWKVGGVEVEEQMPSSKRDHVMRIFFGDDEEELAQFRMEKEIVRLMRKRTSGNKRFYDCFPRLLAEGDLGSMNFEGVSIPTYLYTPAVPKPFYIMEKIGPSLEALFRSGRTELMTPTCAALLIIGCVQTLRLLHEAGIVCRDVQPCNFSIRLGPTGKLNRREADVASRIVLTHFTLARPFRKTSVRSGLNCIGTQKYSSPSAMRFEEVMPSDDLVSCMYMLYEFITGKLPWTELVTFPETKVHEATCYLLEYEQILEKKEEFETTDRIMDGKRQELFHGFDDVYKEIQKGNGLDEPIDYHEIVALLGRGVDHREDKDKDETLFSFQQATVYTYRHGVQTKDNLTLLDGSKTAETEEMRYKADYLFPTTKNKKKEEKKSKRESRKSKKESRKSQKKSQKSQK